MAYYIDTIEQVKGEEEGTINEYGKREKQSGTFEQAQSAFFTKLANVSNDLVTIDSSKKHYFMDIRIVDSKGGVLEKKSIGTYQDT